MMKSSKIRRIVLSLTVAMFVVFGLGVSNAFAAEQGTVTMSVEKATLGQGYLIAPTKVAVNDGESLETVTKRFLDSTVGAGNYTFDTAYGTAYLSGIKDASMKGEDTDLDLSKVPQYIQDAATVVKRPITTKANQAGWLKEFDFNAGGGYTYSINNTWGQGMNKDTVKNGDVVRIAYSIVGYGNEWGVAWEDKEVQWPTYPDRIALLKTMGEAEELALEGSDEYKAAVTAATALPGDEATINAAQTTLQAKVDAAKAFDGTATVSVEKFVLGQGYIIEPTKVPVKSGESAKAVFKRAINQELGYGKYRFAGWSTWVADDSMKAQDTDLNKGDIPAYIIDKIGADNIKTAANEAGWLGSFDFLEASGFVATKNNAGFTQAFDNEIVNNGDVLRLGYSFAMGSDWINSEGEYAWEQTYANVDELQKTMVAAKEAGLSDTETYKSAVKISSTLPGDQAAVDKVRADLQALIDGKEYPISVVVDVEKFTMGQGFLVEPKVVKAKVGEKATDVIKRYLDENVGSDGYKIVTTEYGSYLAAVKDASMQKADTDLDLNKVPSYIKEKIDADKVSVSTAAAEAGWLTEKDFCSTGGFMYTVNDNGMDVGIDGYTVQDNDVIRIGYSLYGYGSDWYKPSYQPWDVNYAPKALAIAAIADANKYGVTGDKVDALKAEAAKLPGDQSAVEAAGKAVMDEISAKVPGKLLGNAKGQGYNYKSEWKVNGEIGTTGQGKKLTGVKFDIQDNENLGISYEAHVADVGWMDAVTNGAEAGKGNNAIEAVRIKLTGSDADKYDVFYRVHVANIGWMQWTKNGEMAGTQGFGYAAEAIEAYIAPKGYTFDHNEFAYKNASQQAEKGSGRAHIQNIGNGQGFIGFNQRKTALIGTTGRALRVEGITLNDQDPDLNITYNAHCQNVGWTGFKKEGEFAGTEGKSLRMEAIQIKVDGPNAEKYDVEYRAHVQNKGWMDWKKNGETAGTVGQALRLEAIEIRFVEK